MQKRKSPVHSSSSSSATGEKESLITDDEESESEHGGFLSNVIILIFLYILQGIPLGISAAIPTLLVNAGITYHEQALFSFAFWPFSVKLIWAPIVDTKYIKVLGLRKTWILFTQLLIGIMMFLLSNTVDGLLESRSILLLTCVFVVLNFLAATQDIAVDGWALTILPKKHVGWASTCNSVGQVAGYFIGNVGLLTLESPHFANSYIRSVPAEGGLISFSSFLLFWGVFFIVGSILVTIFKREVEHPATRENDQATILQTYTQLYRICRLPVVQSYVALVLTWKIGFSAAEGISSLKFLEAGLTRDRMALMAVPLTPIQLLLPLAISHISSGPKPLIAALDASFYRLLMCCCFPVLVYWTHSFGGEFPFYYYAVVILVYCIHQIFANGVFVNLMAYHAKVSDPSLGGTYMTLLNTFTNLGGNWPVTLALWFVDDLTFKTSSADGEKSTIVDGFYVECFLCFVIGLIWLKFVRSRVESIQFMGTAAWTMPKR